MSDRVRLTFAAAPPATVAAAADDQPRRQITGQIVPYGVPGDTSAGRLTVNAGALRLPDPLRRVKLLTDHDRTQPVGYLAAAHDTPAELAGVFQIARTSAGDVALVEAEDGARDALSVELTDVQISGDQITSATLAAVALVPIPAYASAVVDTVAAAQHDPTPADGAGTEQREESAMTDPTQLTPPPDDDDTQPITAAAGVFGELVHAGARVPAAVTAARPRQSPPLQLRDLIRARAQLQATGPSPEVAAALADVTQSANPWTEPAQFVDELWSGVAYERQIVPFLRRDTLTGYKVTGWRWTTPPEVAPWAGDKTAVPSNSPATELVETDAKRLAGAHDVDRKFRDFGDESFWRAYYAAMTASYALQSDTAALADLLAEGTATTAPDVGAAVTRAIFQVAKYGRATKVLLAENLLEQVAGMTVDTLPVAVQSMFAGKSLDELASMSHRSLPADTVIGWDRNAATFHELPGSPIRVEAVDMTRGGVDAGVFGYYASIVHQPGAISVVTVGGAQQTTRSAGKK